LRSVSSFWLSFGIGSFLWKGLRFATPARLWHRHLPIHGRQGLPGNVNVADTMPGQGLGHDLIRHFQGLGFYG